ncbi:MAG: hypothetical protein PHU94_00930 [Bacilli bacterium]|nr:hypothetical protein [Bacilli bacterium]MDD4733483.1 hypothetical protein [Bacilli bacterium]
MKMMKCLGLMMVGAGVVILYNRYNEPVMDAIKQKVSCTCNELEDMM